MKIKLGTLRKLIQEEVENVMGGKHKTLDEISLMENDPRWKQYEFLFKNKSSDGSYPDYDKAMADAKNVQAVPATFSDIERLLPEASEKFQSNMEDGDYEYDDTGEYDTPFDYAAAEFGIKYYDGPPVEDGSLPGLPEDNWQVLTDGTVAILEYYPDWGTRKPLTYSDMRQTWV